MSDSIEQTESFLGEATDDAFRRSWAAWHQARLRATLSPLGLASLAATHWLTNEPTPYDGVPGVWSATRDGVRGVAEELTGSAVLQDGEPYATVGGDGVTLRSGQEIAWGDKRLRYFERDGVLALRLIDPDAPTRSAVRDILAFEPDENWVYEADFTPADADHRFRNEAIDGHVAEEHPAGTVSFDLNGEAVSLTVTGGPRGFSAVLADGTSGSETYRFRFLRIDAPGADGRVRVDFNRLYLPPCAFSDFYVCPLPPAGNRLTTPIRAGEKNLDLVEQPA